MYDGVVKLSSDVTLKSQYPSLYTSSDQIITRECIKGCSNCILIKSSELSTLLDLIVSDII